MIPMTLARLAQIIGGRLVRGNPRALVKHAIHGRTSSVHPGVVFFINTSVDISKQVNQLRGKRSAAVVAPREWIRRIPAHHPVISVPDPTHAAYRLSRWLRSRSKAVFIGVTGSAGKTTTKEMIASIAMQKYRTLKSRANNNLFAYIPTNLFPLNPTHQVVVLEMGMASLGNIRKQCLYAQPSIGVITNIREAHVGSLGNSLKNVARAKQELIDGIRPGGTVILNADDPISRKLSLKRFRGKVITYGMRNPATLRAHRIRFARSGMSFQVGGHTFFIPTWGMHNVYNALAAIAVGRQLNIPMAAIQRGLRSFRPPSMRLQPLRGIKGFTLINDAYNANPSSMIAGLHVLKQLDKKAPKVAVLGDMAELGAYSRQGHRRVGSVVARQINPHLLITIGPRAAEIARSAAANGMPQKRIRSFPSQAAADAFIRRAVPSGAILYFKASRSVRLEKLVKRLQA